VMASAIQELMAKGGSPREALLESAYARGRAAGRAERDFEEVLARYGYRPEADDDGGYSLVNCPFHRLAESHTTVVCALNGAFLSGAAAACGIAEDRIADDNREGHCCARILPAD